MAVQPEKVRAELARILEFEGITNSAMLSAFLRFIVAETLAGRAERLRAYTIAVEALDRPKDFDPNENPLVRVQARRLRDVLSRYYADPGNVGELRIDLPVGAYIPEFVSTKDTSSVQQGLPAQVPHKFMPLVYGLLGALVLAGLLFAVQYVPGLITDKAHSDRLEAITADYPPGTGLDATRVLPQVFFSIDVRAGTHDWFNPERYVQRLGHFAQQFNDYVVMRPQDEAQRFAASQPTYNLHFAFNKLGDAMRGVLQVTDANDGRLLHVQEVFLTEGMTAVYRPGSAVKTPSDLNALRLVIEGYGLIYNDIMKLSSVTGPLACLAKTYAFQTSPTQPNHLAARQCLEDTITKHPKLMQAFALLGDIYMNEYLYDLNPLPGNALERAEAALNKAIRLSPESAQAYQYTQYLMLLKGDPEAALRLGQTSVKLNPESMDAAGSYGCILSLLGRYEEAASLLLRAEERLILPPQWLQFNTFMTLNNLGRLEEASYHGGELAGSAIPLFMSAIAIKAHRDGNDAAAKRTIDAMIEAQPQWQSNPLGLLKRYGFSDDVAQKLFDDLVTSGLQVRARSD